MKFKSTETIEYLHEAPDADTGKANYKTGTARRTFFSIQSIPEPPPNPPVAAVPPPAANPPASNEPAISDPKEIPAPAKALEPAPKP